MPTVDSLLDTDVLIEYLRGTPAAAGWLADRSGDVPGIPYVSALEVLQGARNGRELQRLRQWLGDFACIPPEPEDAGVALRLYETHALRSGCGILDCLIGALAARLSVPIYTFNTKHLGCLDGVDARRPYERAG